MDDDEEEEEKSFVGEREVKGRVEGGEERQAVDAEEAREHVYDEEEESRFVYPS